MLDLMQQELDFSRGEALTLASLTVDLIRRPAFTYRSSSVPGKPQSRKLDLGHSVLQRLSTFAYCNKQTFVEKSLWSERRPDSRNMGL